MGALKEKSISKARFLRASQCLGHTALLSLWNSSLQEWDGYFSRGEISAMTVNTE